MNPKIEIFSLSTRTGEGVTQFTEWLEKKVTGK
jgi:Ni2+-binding GTPase involved in maturation of urease and hydrogenase